MDTKQTIPAKAPIYQSRGKYLVNEVVLHCAALNAAQLVQFGKMTGAQMKAEIDAWHRARGFNGFGYHGMFLPNGSFIEGRPFTTQGAHVVERNRGTLGFLMIESSQILKMGRFEDFFTEAQRAAVRAKISALPGIKWVTGHNDYANKLCPGFKVKDGDWLPMTRVLLILLALLGLGLAFQSYRASHLRTAYLDAMDDLAASQHAAKVLGGYYATLLAERERWADIEVDLNTKEGADAPLSDYGRAVLDRVRTP